MKTKYKLRSYMKILETLNKNHNLVSEIKRVSKSRFEVTKKHLEEMTGKGLVKTTKVPLDSRIDKKYYITEYGKETLKKYMEIERIVE